MKYPITLYGNPLLRKKAKPVGSSHNGLKEIIENMWETMYDSDGVGLAAPQVGLSICLFLIDATAVAGEDPQLKDLKKVFINPEIIETLGEDRVVSEGCLSLPEINEEVRRSNMVKIKYFDENFISHEEEFSGYGARIIQHEYDHLEGILFIDHLSPLTKRLLRSKLRDISQGKVKPHYRIKAAKQKV